MRVVAKILLSTGLYIAMLLLATRTCRTRQIDVETALWRRVCLSILRQYLNSPVVRYPLITLSVQWRPLSNDDRETLWRLNESSGGGGWSFSLVWHRESQLPFTNAFPRPGRSGDWWCVSHTSHHSHRTPLNSPSKSTPAVVGTLHFVCLFYMASASQPTVNASTGMGDYFKSEHDAS